MTTTCDEQSLRDVIARHGGVLASGAHGDDYDRPDCPVCVLEAHAACLVERGAIDAMTDDPELLGRPDYRAINDALWSSREAATEPLIRLHLAYAGWAEWDEPRRREVMARVVIGTVRVLLPMLPGLPTSIAARCRSATTLDEAYGAAAAAYAARAAAADADAVLIAAIDEVWIPAARAAAGEGGDAEGRA